MKFIKDIFKYINDPDGLLNVLGLIMLCMVIMIMIAFCALGVIIYRLFTLI